MPNTSWSVPSDAARSLHAVLLCTVAIVAWGPRLAAQQTSGEPRACPWTIGSPDSIDTALAFELTSPSLVGVTGRDAVRRQSNAARLLLQKLRSTFVPPARLDVPVSHATVFVMPADGGRFDAVPDLTASVTFTLFADGQVRNVRVTRPSPSPVLDTALAAAVRRAGEAKVLSGLALDLGGDSVLAEVATNAESGGFEPSVPLTRVRLPLYRVEPAMPVFPVPAPEYPPAALRAGVMDSIKLRFVIDTLGRIDGESLSVIAATYRDFVKAVFAVLPRTRYQPAVSSGCPIATRVVAPYNFSLRK